jgi:hypothetical protein
MTHRTENEKIAYNEGFSCGFENGKAWSAKKNRTVIDLARDGSIPRKTVATAIMVDVLAIAAVGVGVVWWLAK